MAKQPASSPPALRLRGPKPVAFTLAVIGMAAVTCVALDAAGHSALVPAPLLHLTIAYVAPLSKTLFGQHWMTIVQVIAVSAWAAHLFEALHVAYRMHRARATATARVSWVTWVGYVVGVFIGGYPHGSRCLAELARLEKTGSKK
jgi:hypothetical protein